jgi:hypothetical protein
VLLFSFTTTLACGVCVRLTRLEQRPQITIQRLTVGSGQDVSRVVEGLTRSQLPPLEADARAR